MPLARWLRVPAAVVITAAVVSCASANEPVLVPSNATLAVEVFGGWTPYRWTTFVESSESAWRKIRCDPTVSASPCPRGTPLASGNVTPAALQELLDALQSSAFRAVPNEVPGGGGPEVDGSLYTLTVMAGNAPRTVIWRSGAVLPAALEDVLRRLDTATGSAWRSP